MVFLLKPGNHVKTYRHGTKCQKQRVAKAAFHVHGKKSRSKGQIRSDFAALLLRPIVSQKTQTSKRIELKFGVKQHERGQFCKPNSVMTGEGEGGYKISPKVPKFMKIEVLASISCCQVRVYLPIILNFGTKQYTVNSILNLTCQIRA